MDDQCHRRTIQETLKNVTISETLIFFQKKEEKIRKQKERNNETKFRMKYPKV